MSYPPLRLQHLHDDLAFVGPPLSEGPLPAVFYLALSGKDSLSLDPFNQPVVYLSQFPMRIFSITLPGHEQHLPAQDALFQWAYAFERGDNPIQSCLDHIQQAMHQLLGQKMILKDKLGICGLSRGAFMATHVAAHMPIFHTILGFAPLTKLGLAKEFQSVHADPKISAMNLECVAPALIHSSIRFYIGNVDTRVHTRSCFDFIDILSHTAVKQGIRSPQCELIISPSIGRDGHGTSQEIFHQGAHWLASQLKVTDGL